MSDKEKWEIHILDPKVKGLLEELQHLQLIEINKLAVADIKSSYLEKFEGKNLLEIDTTDITID